MNEKITLSAAEMSVCRSPICTCATEMHVKRKQGWQDREVSLTMTSCLGAASAGKAQH